MSELFSKLVANGFHDINFKITGGWNWLFLRWFNGIFRTKILTKKKEGYFDWEIVAQ
jgi:hypothetical protein